MGQVHPWRWTDRWHPSEQREARWHQAVMSRRSAIVPEVPTEILRCACLHSSEMSETEHRFALACDELGWGDGTGGVWFMGIEECSEWPPDTHSEHLVAAIYLPPVARRTTGGNQL